MNPIKKFFTEYDTGGDYNSNHPSYQIFLNILFYVDILSIQENGRRKRSKIIIILIDN